MSSSVQMSGSRVPDSALAELNLQVYPLRIQGPEEVIVSATIYADHLPRNFMPTAAKIKRSISGDEDSITVQLRLGAGPDTVFTNPVLIIGEVTDVALGAFSTAVQNDGLAEDTRLSAVIVLTPATPFVGYTDSQGLQIDLLGRWTS